MNNSVTLSGGPMGGTIVESVFFYADGVVASTPVSGDLWPVAHDACFDGPDGTRLLYRRVAGDQAVYAGEAAP